MTEDRADALDAGRMTIWEHLAELRTRLIRSTIALVIGTAAGFFLYPYIWNFLIDPYKAARPGVQVAALGVAEGFTLRMQASLYIGIALAMPVILWQVWRFVTPGLYAHEKRYAVPFTISALVLFVLGAGVAYLSLTPTLEFLTNVSGIEDLIEVTSAESYLKLNLFMMLAFGAGFEFPVLLVALMLVGVLQPRQLLGWWRYATVLIAVVAAVITPSGDPISMLALAVPMEVLYFVAIGIGALVARRTGPAAIRD